MKKLIAFLATALLCLTVHPSYAQNIEGQIVASQFGAYQVPGIATGSLHFEPATCQVTGGGKNFAAFTVDVPLKIVDSNPALNEIDTPAAVFISDCSISMTTSHIHATPFYVTSGTGGLQEALINGPSKAGGPNTVILDANWYTQVLPGNPATVIASVKGSTALGLVDVTTSPYTYYTWGGSAYAQVAPPSQLPGGNGVVKVVSGNGAIATPNVDYTAPSGSISGTAANLSGTPALPNGTTAPTQTTGDNSTKLATDAFVIANTGGATFPGTNGVVFNTGVGTSRNATASDLNAVFGYTPISAAYWGALTGCATSGYVYSPQSNSCIQVGGVPGGIDTQFQFNNAGAFGGSTVTFNSSTKALTLGPIGSTAGSNSGPLLFTSLYDTGSGLSLDTYDFHVQIGSGVNPFSQLVIDHPGGTPGGSEILFLPQLHIAGSLVVQTGSVLQIADLTPSSSVCTNSFSQLSTAACGGGGSGALTPKDFGAVGDGVSIANGCTTNGTTTIVCAAGPFVSGDVGKEIWVTGAGAAGVAFGSTIATFVSSTTVTAAATPPTNVTSSQTVFGHDDVVALQDCFNASAASNVPCVLGVPINFNTPNGYLIAASGLTIPTKANIQGSSSNDGTTILSEFNGDAFSMSTSTASLQAGQPVEAITLANFSVFHDPSQPNGRGFHINAAPGVFGFGGMFNSHISDVSDVGAALECLWLDGHLNTDNNPNQYITFDQFKCNGPSQSHPANEIKITGIQAQILFLNGSIDGDGNASHYANPLIWVGEKTSGQQDSPVAVTFFGFTYESGAQGMRVGDGAGSIHFEDGYVESIESPLILQGPVNGFTYKGNNIANSGNVGAVVQASDSVSNTSINATIQDNRVWGSTTPAAFAVCTGSTSNFNIDFHNNESTVQTTSSCATNHAGTGAALLQVFGATATVDPSVVVVTTILDPNISPGKTLTLNALSGGSFSLGTGGTLSGNQYPINLGAFASPLVVTSGNSVTLALLDQGSLAYTVVSGTNLPATALVGSETVVSTANPVFSTAFGTSYIVLGGNVTGPVLGAGADGQHKTLCIKQGAGPYTFASPANFKGFMTIGTVNGGLNCQSFVYNATISDWLADSPGVINQ